MGTASDTLKAWGLGLVNDLTHSKAFINPIDELIAKYGEIDELCILRREKKITVAVSLKGEDRPLRIVIDKYSIRRTEAGFFLKVEQASVSRIWLQEIVQVFLVGKELPLPGKFEVLGRMLQ